MTADRAETVIELYGERTQMDCAASEPTEVPYTMLSPDALNGVLENVVLRDGTDYGERERTLEQKVAELRERLRMRQARIIFDPQSQTVDIQPANGKSK
jgi:uncharacterized protein YheU (UPF0270 family)